MRSILFAVMSISARAMDFPRAVDALLGVVDMTAEMLDSFTIPMRVQHGMIDGRIALIANDPERRHVEVAASALVAGYTQMKNVVGEFLVDGDIAKCRASLQSIPETTTAAAGSLPAYTGMPTHGMSIVDFQMAKFLHELKDSCRVYSRALDRIEEQRAVLDGAWAPLLGRVDRFTQEAETEPEARKQIAVEVFRRFRAALESRMEGVDVAELRTFAESALQRYRSIA